MLFRSARLKIYYFKKSMWRISRILFPSPAEMKFVQIMGGRVLTIPFIKRRPNGFCLAFVLSFGRVLRREFVEREVRVGAYYIDFAFVTRYAKKGIEIDGAEFHRDIVKEQERDDYLAQYGWEIFHIEAVDLYRNPDMVQRRVINFLRN